MKKLFFQLIFFSLNLLIAIIFFLGYPACAGAMTLITDAELFNSINLDYIGMSAIKSAVNAGNYTLAKSELLKYYQNRPEYSTGTPYGRTYFALATTGDIARANDALNHCFTQVGQRYCLGTNINWYTNPSTDPEWIVQFNGHGAISNCGQVYAQTSDERYAQEAIAEIKDWLNDVTSVSHPNALWTAERGASWVRAYQYLVNKYDSPSITSNDHATWLKGIKAHADYLSTVNTSGNWGSTEQSVLLMVAVMFPEFKSATSWLNTAATRSEGHLNTDFLADGVHFEMATDYHRVAVGSFIRPYELVKMNNLNPFSSAYLDRLEKAIEFQMFINEPDSTTPALSDADRNYHFIGDVKKGADLYGRQDMLYAYSSGASGTAPTEISKNYPNGGYTIMRSGWGTSSNFTQQLYLVFDCGPLGGPLNGSHGHSDWLNFEAYAYGKQLIIDPGRYTYDPTLVDGTDWRKYFKITKAHNTIVVDGKDQITYSGAWAWSNPPTYKLMDWETNGGFDFVDGWVQSQNYPIKHERKIFFIRNEYWIISDLLTGTDTNNHSYDQYFHLPKEAFGKTALDITSKSVTSSYNNLKIIPADPANIASASVINDWDEVSYGSKAQSPTIKYTKSGQVPVTFDTIIYPSPSTAPTITVTRLSASMGGNSVSTNKASGLKIDVGSNDDFYFIAHDTSISANYKYSTFQLNGVAGYLRKDAGGTVTNIQLIKATELTDNGISLASTYGIISNISSKGGKVEIVGTGVTNYRIFAPNATSVKINGTAAVFTQSGNYVVNTGGGETVAPSVPTNLRATAVSSSQINLSWTASTDNVGVAGYRIYRSGGQIGTSVTNSFSDTGLLASTAYGYTVAAYDAAGNVSGQSTSASATTQSSVATGPIAHLKFDETFGTTASDSSGNGNIGTLVNGPIWTAGKIGNALNFDGTDDYMSVSGLTSFHKNYPNFTVSMWFKANSNLNNVPVSQNVDLNNKAWYLMILNDGNVSFFYVTTIGTYIDRKTTTPAIIPNAWNHISLIVNRTTGNTVKIFVNGVEKTLNSFAVDATWGVGNPLFRVGISRDHKFDGLIDDMRVYNRALSASEIQTLYNSASTDTTSPSPPTNVVVS